MTVLNFRGKIKGAQLKVTKTGKMYEIKIESHLDREQVAQLDDWADEWADFSVDELQVGHTPFKATNGQMTLDEAIGPEPVAPVAHAALSTTLECSEPSEWCITAQKQSTAEEPNPPVQTLHACTFHAEQALIEARAYAGEFGIAERAMLQTGDMAMPCFYGRLDLSHEEAIERLSDEEIAAAGASLTDAEVADAEAEDRAYQGDGDALAGEATPEVYEGDVPEEPVSDGHPVEPEPSAADGLRIDAKYKLCACGHTRLMHVMPEDPEDPGALWGECAACTCPQFTDIDSVITPGLAETEPAPKAGKRGGKKSQRELLGIADSDEVA